MRIVHVCQNTLARKGMLALLQQEEELEVVSLSNKNDLPELLSNSLYDAVILDVLTVDDAVLNSIRFIQQNHNPVQIVVICCPSSPAKIAPAIGLGVKGFLTNECDSEEIIDALKAVQVNKKFYCNKIMHTIMKRQFDQDDCCPTSLSKREIEITTLLAKGNTNRQVAETLFLSIHTIGTHRKNIMKKLNIHSISELVLYAVSTGLITE